MSVGNGAGSGLLRPLTRYLPPQAVLVITAIAGGLVILGLTGPLRMTLIASAITLVMVWRWRSLTPLTLMIIAVAGSLTFTPVGKAIVGRARPPLSDAVPPYEHAIPFLPATR